MSITSNNLKVREVIHQVVKDPAYREVSHIPLISLHQIALILIAYIGVLGGIALSLYAEMSLWIVYPIMIFCFYTAFTPLHDATHRAVSSNNFLNDLLGTISGFILFPFVNTAAYRYLHLAHHRYVGDKDLDPDEPMVHIPTKYFPLGYLSLLFPDFIWVHWLLFKAWDRTPSKTRISVCLMVGGNLLFHTLWFLSPWGFEYFILFFIPNRLGMAYTVYAFAHIPHPEGLKWNDFPFQATFSLKGNPFYLQSLYGQQHHSTHHFLPHVPWYKYYKVWDLANGIFSKQHIPVKQVFTRPDPKHKDKIIKEVAAKQRTTLLAKVVSIETVAKNVKSFILEPANENETLPEFTAGSHIDVFLPSGKVRSYSCLNPPYDTNKYQIAVKLDPLGKGGSKEMHEQISIGDSLQISYPKNHFVLYENAKKFILFAGGIGITPLLSMAHRLTEIDKHFELHICAQKAEDIPFQYELSHWTFAPNVVVHLDKNGKSSMDIDKVLANPAQDTLIYICGPSGFNKWVKQTAISKGWEKDQLLQEVFSMNDTEVLEPKDFQLILNKRGTSIPVKKDETIIDALQRNNIKVPYSCLQGTCGSCITKVIEGEIDHRDAVLSEEEKTGNELMCLCVSRAKDDKLVIDI